MHVRFPQKLHATGPGHFSAELKVKHFYFVSIVGSKFKV